MRPVRSTNRRAPSAASRRRRSCSSTASGNLLRAWGGAADPGFLTNRCTPAMGCEWPTNEHGIFVDHNDNVWIAGNGGGNHQVLKFSRDGTFLLQIGKAGVTGRQQRHGRRSERHAAARPTGRRRGRSDEQRGLHRRRLPEQARAGRRRGRPASTSGTGAPTATCRTTPTRAVIAPGIRPRRSSATRCTACASPTTDWSTCATGSTTGSRCSEKNGHFVKEFFVDRDTLGNGSTWDVDVSSIDRQRYLYNADGENQQCGFWNA